MTENTTNKPWEFNPELDTNKSYAAFTYYLELGRDRTVDQAYTLYIRDSKSRLKREDRQTKRTPKYFSDWATAGQWISRAAYYDVHIKKEAAAIADQRAILTYADKLEKFRQESESLGNIFLTQAGLMAKLVNRSLQFYENKKHILTPREAGEVAKASNAIAQTGRILKAQALGIEDLQRLQAEQLAMQTELDQNPDE